MRIANIINFALLLVIIFLGINLIDPTLTGNIVQSIDNSEAQCTFTNNGELNNLTAQYCCVQIAKMYDCQEIVSDTYSKKCFISENSEKYFLVNDKMLDICRQEGYDVKDKQGV